MDRRTVARLENVYEHVDDIDLFPGGMAEKPVVGGIVGESREDALMFRELNQGKNSIIGSGTPIERNDDGFHSCF